MKKEVHYKEKVISKKSLTLREYAEKLDFWHGNTERTMYRVMQEPIFWDVEEGQCKMSKKMRIFSGTLRDFLFEDFDYEDYRDDVTWNNLENDARSDFKFCYPNIMFFEFIFAEEMKDFEDHIYEESLEEEDDDEIEDEDLSFLFGGKES